MNQSPEPLAEAKTRTNAPIDAMPPSMFARAANYFILSAGAILLVTAAAKLWTAFGSARVLDIEDPIVGIHFRHLILAVGIAELLIGLFCVFAKKPKLAMLFVLFLSTNFLAYRLCLWWIKYPRPCACLGSMTEALHIAPETADGFMKVVLAYLFIGACGLLIWQWQQYRTMTSNHADQVNRTAPSDAAHAQE